MSDEQLLVIALSVTSTFAAGLATDSEHAHARFGAARMIAVVFATAVLVPAFAWGLDATLDLGASGVGLIVASAAPGGSTGPLLALVGGGDVASARRLFLVTAIVGTVTAIAAILAIGVFDPKLVGRAATLVGAASLAPLAVGFAMRRWLPGTALALARPFARVGIVLLVVTVVLFCVRYGEQTVALDLALAGLLVLGSFVPALFVRGRGQRIAVAQVSAVRNLALALLVLAALDAPARATLAVLAYGLAMFVGAGALAIAARFFHRNEARA